MAQAKLNDFCQDHYGQEPGDVDADNIIDAVFGGCGVPSGMKAADFDATMRALTTPPIRQDGDQAETEGGEHA